MWSYFLKTYTLDRLLDSFPPGLRETDHPVRQRLLLERALAIFPNFSQDNTESSQSRELIGQMKRVSGEKATYRLYTDEKRQYRIALREDAVIGRRTREGDFEHVQINSQRPRSLSNDLFSVNYLDREVRKDLPEYHRQTVCFGRNVGNGLERLCVYFYHHNFIKKYRIGVKGENRTHAEVAGLSKYAVMRIRSQVTKNRRFIGDGEIVKGGFFEELWKRRIPTPLKNKPDYLPNYAIA